ncbi:MAG: large subunit ribosomal protein [Acidobacteriota bacterium]|jgi:large subunit ribosomal protein L21|nr:large subunit ribosomal protein [Acidobacteriota bacterium]
MYAVIESGGKQYRVSPGDLIDVELLSGSEEGKSEAGKSIRFDRVLAVVGDNGPQLGGSLEGAAVTASLVGEVLGPKIRVFKKKKRTTYRRTTGHRQHMHRVRIDEIQLPSSR